MMRRAHFYFELLNAIRYIYWQGLNDFPETGSGIWSNLNWAWYIGHTGDQLHNLKMNSLKEVYSNRWTAWWRRHSTALQVATSISCNVAYFAETGYTRTATMLSIASLGKRISISASLAGLVAFVRWLRWIEIERFRWYSVNPHIIRRDMGFLFYIVDINFFKIFFYLFNIPII